MRHITKQLNQNLVFAVNSLHLSRPNKPLNFHTKTHIIQTLRNCNDLVLATLTHAKILKSGLLNDTFTTNRLINCYTKLQKTAQAYQLFGETPEPDVVSYTSVMSGYVNEGKPQNCLCLFREMQNSTVLPNEFTFSTAVSACSTLASLKCGKTIHALVEIFGFQCNLVVCSSLVDMYGKCKEVDLARRVFDSMEYKHVVAWTSMIQAFTQNGRGHEALEVFREFNRLGWEHPDQLMLTSVITACASLGKLASGKVTHGAVIQCGYDSNGVVSSALVDMYAKCGCIVYSEKVFRRVSSPSLIPYTSMIVAAGKYGLGRLSLELFEEMLCRRIKPNDVTFVGLLHACSHSGLVGEGLAYFKSMYSKHGIVPDVRHYTCVVDMLGGNGRLDEAYQFAKSIEVNDQEGALLWGTLLSACRHHGRVDIAIEASKRLIELNQEVARAYVTLSNICILAGERENAQSLRNCDDLLLATLTHAKILKSGLLNDTFTTTCLINCYVRLQKTSQAYHLFREMPEPNVVSYTSVMSGYVSEGKPQNSLCLFREMQKSTVLPNEFTFATAVSACSMLASLKCGKTIHALVEIFGFQCNLVVCNSLVDMYGKCKEVDLAWQVFDSMEYKHVVAWTSMIQAFTQNGRGHEALEVFREFNRLGWEHPDQLMLTSVITACASLGKLASGKVTHGAVIQCGYDSNGVVSSALVDMYAKCGCIVYSEKAFRRVSNPSLIPYTSMIVAAGKYGLGRLSLELFEEMLCRRIKPDDVTFVGLLHACSHSGLVDEGLEYFKSMYSKHGIVPDVRHYTCVVDMLCRNGRLDEAYRLAKSIEVNDQEGALLWGTLLSASRLHGRVDIVVEASKILIELNQLVAPTYVTLSNTYVLAGEWENAQNLRAKMKQTGVCKEPGCSWVESSMPETYHAKEGARF